MQTYDEQLEAWTANNRMIIILMRQRKCFLVHCPSPAQMSFLLVMLKLNVQQALNCCVSTSQLSDLKWNTHIDKICAKASTRLCFLKQLKVGWAVCGPIAFYLSAIRPILDYCSVVWHHGLTKTQVEQLEAIQRHAIRIIFEVTFNMPYHFAMAYANISSLRARREHLNKNSSERFWIILKILCSVYYHHPVTLLLKDDSDQLTCSLFWGHVLSSTDHLLWPLYEIGQAIIFSSCGFFLFIYLSPFFLA